MNITGALELYITALIMGILGYASWKDVNERRVENRVWVLMVCLGLPAGLLIQLAYYKEYGIPIALYSLASSAITCTIAVLLFQLGLYGGADAKAMIALSLIRPLKIWGNSVDLVPITTFANSVVLSLSAIVPILGWNTYMHFVRHVKLFEGYEAGLPTKILVLITSIKVKKKELARSMDKYIVIEEWKNGKKYLRLKIKYDEQSTVTHSSQEEYVWVTPTLPFILFILLGYILTLMNVNLALNLAKMLVAPIIDKL